jgi:hypothetical protein
VSLLTSQSVIAEAFRAAEHEDRFWRGYLTNSPDVSIHVAILTEPYLRLILEHKKTIESRFSVHRCIPYNRVNIGDVLLLKRSGGPIVGLASVTQTWFYRLTATPLDEVKRLFDEDLCISDPAFWESQQRAEFASFMRLRHVCTIAPLTYIKKDRRAWVILQPSQRSLPRQEILFQPTPSRVDIVS